MNRHSIRIDLIDAWQCLRHQLVRSLLSALGMAIGTMALVSMLSIGEGARQQALQRVMSLGIDNIRIENRFEQLIASGNLAANNARGVSTMDSEVLALNFPSADMGLFYREQNVNIVAQGKSSLSEVLLVNHAWLGAESLNVQIGRAFNSGDEFKQVCIAGHQIAQELGVHNRLGSLLSWQGKTCKLIGVLEPKGRLLTEGTSLSELNFDTSIYAPIKSYASDYNRLSGLTIKLNVEEPSTILQAAEKIDGLLYSQRQIVDRDYLVVSPISLIQKTEQDQQTFTFVLGAIAGLSLLVGGIGIMNVMLAHVAEQTREIGLRLAVGADESRVIFLFLSYSFLISFIGTLIGLVLGVLCGILIQQYAGWNIGYSISSMMIGPVFSILSGVLFGLYPARKASNIPPSQALRQV